MTTDRANATMLDPSARVPLSTKFGYALPGMPLQVLHMSALAIVPTFYAKNTAVSVGTIGLVLLGTRIFDAVFHPLIGFLSDASLARSGSRKSWIVVGSILCAISVYFLFTPHATSGPLYFMLWSTLLFASWTVLEVPHRAWGTELSRDYRERSNIFAIAGQARLLAAMLFYSAPLLSLFPSSDMTRPGFFSSAGIALAVLLPLTALLSVATVPNGRKITAARSTVSGLVRSVIRNKPLCHFVVVYGLCGIGSGLYNSVLLLFVTSYLHLGEKYPYLGILYYAISLPMVSVWRLLANRIGKHRAWALGLGTFALLLPLYWFIEPGPHTFQILILLGIPFAMSSSTEFLIPISVLGDVVDYDILKTGVNRSGNYTAILQFISTSQIAIGGGLGFLFLGAFHFSAKAANGPWAIVGLKLTLLVIPALLYLIATILILRSPIDARRHAVISKRIAARAERISRKEKESG